MSNTPDTKPTEEVYLRTAGPVMLARQENPTGSLTTEQKTALQEATLTVVREFRTGRSAEEIHTQLINNNWKSDVAHGFIALVSQLLSKMYLQRSFIFGGLAIFTSMLASIAVPEAAQGQFPWLAATLSAVVAGMCILGTLRHLQLYYRYRQRPGSRA